MAPHTGSEEDARIDPENTEVFITPQPLSSTVQNQEVYCSHLGPLWKREGRYMAAQGRKSPGLKESMPATRAREMGEVRREHDTGTFHQTFSPTPKDPDVFGWNT